MSGGRSQPSASAWGQVNGVHAGGRRSRRTRLPASIGSAPRSTTPPTHPSADRPPRSASAPNSRWRDSALVRRQVVVPVAELLEGSPEALLGALFVQRLVDVRDVEGVDGGGEGLDLALTALDRAGEGDAEPVEDAQRRLAHHHDDLRLHDRQLLDQARHALAGGEVGLRDRAFDAEGAVDDERVDPEAFEAFHQRVAGAAVEGDPLLDLRGHRRVLEHEDVGLRVARAEHRHQLAPRAVPALLDLAAHLVELTDRPLQVLLTYLVVD